MRRIAHSALRAGWGLVLISRPRQLLRLAGHDGSEEGPVVVARVLGARHVAQAAVLAATSHPTVVTLGRVADGLHAASALGLAAASPTWRRVGLAEGALASALGATTPG